MKTKTLNITTLALHKVGERVIFRVTEMIAIWVEKPQ